MTVADAASPDTSLRFLFYGGVVVIPVIAAYTIGVYWVFRGKIGRRGRAGDLRPRSVQDTHRFHRQRKEETDDLSR